MIHGKMIDILNDIEFIDKKRKTQGGQSYNFRGIDDMYNVLHGLFAKHGVYMTSEVISGTREERLSKAGGLLIYSIIDVRFTFWAKDGSNVSSTMRGEAMDSSDKASNKAMSAALKYALIQAFLIPTEEQIDTEYQNHEVKPKEQEKTDSKTVKVKGEFEKAIKYLSTKETPEEIDIFLQMIKLKEWTDSEFNKLILHANEKKKSFIGISADDIINKFEGEYVDEGTN